MNITELKEKLLNEGIEFIEEEDAIVDIVEFDEQDVIDTLGGTSLLNEYLEEDENNG